MLRKTLLFVIACLAFMSANFAQTENNTLGEPMPEFSLFTIEDSSEFNSSRFNKRGIVLIKVFSPDCEHCQEDAEEFYAKKDRLKKVKTIWVAGNWTPLKDIEAFAEKYHLKELNAKAIGKESGEVLQKHYGITGIPFAALYIHDQLVFSGKGQMNFEELIAIANGKYE